MLQETYNFKKKPIISSDSCQVVLLREDFENLLNLANLWLKQHAVRTPMPKKAHERTPSSNMHNVIDLRMLLNVESGYQEPAPSNQLASLIGKFQPPKVYATMFKAFCPKIKYPLSFLSSRLSQFTKATRIFTTRDYTHTNVAAEFHQACDNIPNTLVIIKSGQYIAGGYTEVAWESTTSRCSRETQKSFIFSANRQEIYPVRKKKCGLGTW